MLSLTTHLRRSFPLVFHAARTLSGSLRSPPSPRGEGFVSGIAVFSYRSLPHRGRGTASAVDRVLSLTAHLRRSLPALFHTAFPIQPPPLRGTSFHRKEGMTTRAPSLGRGCRAQRGGVGFLFLRRSRLLFAFPMGKGDRAAVDRVLSQTAYLRRSFPLVFHTARTLSGSLRSPPSPRGEGC